MTKHRMVRDIYRTNGADFFCLEEIKLDDPQARTMNDISNNG